jgi:hypothetical protein
MCGRREDRWDVFIHISPFFDDDENGGYVKKCIL